MKRDTIFYRIFQQSPTLLLDLLPSPPADSLGYRFESIEVKETSFRIDGVLKPSNPRGLIVFSEVQMQPIDDLYERLFSEIATYTYRHRYEFGDWKAIALYPSRAIEQRTTQVPYELFQSGRISAVYLDELGDIPDLPLGLGLLVLTILDKQRAIEAAQAMMARAQQDSATSAIMEMIATVIVYKFKNLSRDEVYKMLNYTLDELKETRFYREVSEEAKAEGRAEGRAEVLLTLLTARLGGLSVTQQAQLQKLSIDQVQALGIALFDFKTIEDLDAWLQTEAS
jgi:predicted transposase/invertase (TIGR01784 family)